MWANGAALNVGTSCTHWEDTSHVQVKTLPKVVIKRKVVNLGREDI